MLSGSLYPGCILFDWFDCGPFSTEKNEKGKGLSSASHCIKYQLSIKAQAHIWNENGWEIIRWIEFIDEAAKTPSMVTRHVNKTCHVRFRSKYY